jgi:hypothetical protein
MAQTKKKRRSKHRGNAAGVVEARGRTGRKLTVDERKRMGSKLTSDEKRRDRMNREPTWRGAAYRALFAAAIFGVLLLLAFKQDPAPAIGMSSMVFLFYVPLGYFTDQLLYKRRLKKDAQGRTAG